MTRDLRGTDSGRLVIGYLLVWVLVLVLGQLTGTFGGLRLGTIVTVTLVAVLIVACVSLFQRSDAGSSCFLARSLRSGCSAAATST